MLCIHARLCVSAAVIVQAVQDVAEDLDEVDKLRSDVVNLSGSLQALRGTLAKYYRVLCLMESRFPISKSEGQVNLCFVWYDAFR